MKHFFILSVVLILFSVQSLAQERLSFDKILQFHHANPSLKEAMLLQKGFLLNEEHSEKGGKCFVRQGWISMNNGSEKKTETTSISYRVSFDSKGWSNYTKYISSDPVHYGALLLKLNEQFENYTVHTSKSGQIMTSFREDALLISVYSEPHESADLIKGYLIIETIQQ